LARTKDLDVVALRGRYLVDKQIIIPRRISLVGADNRTTVVVDARNDPNAGLWFHLPHRGGWRPPRIPVKVERLNFVAADRSKFTGVGVALVGAFHGMHISHCTFKNLGQRGILLWGALWTKLERNFFSHSGILGRALTPDEPHPEWVVDVSKRPRMEINQLHIVDGEMFGSFPTGKYVVDLERVGAAVIDNFCVENTGGMGTLRLADSADVVFRNLWLEKIHIGADQAREKKLTGHIKLERCWAVTFTGGRIMGLTSKNGVAAVPMFDLTAVHGLRFTGSVISTELNTAGLLAMDERTSNVVFDGNVMQHMLALSSVHNRIITRDNVVSSSHRWLMQAGPDLVDKDLTLKPLPMRVNVPAIKKSKASRYGRVLTMQLASERPGRGHLRFIDATGTQIVAFPLAVGRDPRVVHIGLGGDNVANPASVEFSLNKGRQCKPSAAMAGWKDFPVSRVTDLMGRSYWLGSLPK